MHELQVFVTTRGHMPPSKQLAHGTQNIPTDASQGHIICGNLASASNLSQSLFKYITSLNERCLVNCNDCKTQEAKQLFDTANWKHDLCLKPWKRSTLNINGYCSRHEKQSIDLANIDLNRCQIRFQAHCFTINKTNMKLHAYDMERVNMIRSPPNETVVWVVSNPTDVRTLPRSPSVRSPIKMPKTRLTSPELRKREANCWPLKRSTKLKFIWDPFDWCPVLCLQLQPIDWTSLKSRNLSDLRSG